MGILYGVLMYNIYFINLIDLNSYIKYITYYYWSTNYNNVKLVLYV